MSPRDFRIAREESVVEEEGHARSGDCDSSTIISSRSRPPRRQRVVWVEGYPYLPNTTVKLPQKENNNNNNNNDDDDSHDDVSFHHHHYYVVGTIVSEIFGLNHDDKEDMAQFENLVLESVEGGTTNTLIKVSNIHKVFCWTTSSTTPTTTSKISPIVSQGCTTPSCFSTTHDEWLNSNAATTTTTTTTTTTIKALEEKENSYHRPKTRIRTGTVPNAVLIRLFGAEGMIDRDVENSTFVALAEAGIAPPYYGAFCNGRVEGWMDNMRPLQAQELAQLDIAQGIATQLARLHFGFPSHSLLFLDDNDKDEPVPASSENVVLPQPQADSPTPTLWTQLSQWYEQAILAVQQEKFQTHNDQLRAQDLNLSTTVGDELHWLKSFVIPLQSTRNPSAMSEPTSSSSSSGIGTSTTDTNVRALVRLCHNDVLAANVLYNDTTRQIQLIDFEYGGYNYIAFDIANHWNEYADGPPRETNPNYSWLPTPAQQRAFCQVYLDTAKQTIMMMAAAKEEEEANDNKKNNMTTILEPPSSVIPTLERLMEEI